MESLLILAVAAVGVPVIVRLLLELEKRLSDEKRPKGLVAAKQ